LVFRNQQLRTKLAGFSLFSAPAQEGEPGQLFIVASRKVGGACQRNKLRRRLKAIFYQEGLYKERLVTALICYPGAAEKEYAELKRILRKHLGQRLDRQKDLKGG
jgi:ribonuclease P protein component